MDSLPADAALGDMTLRSFRVAEDLVRACRVVALWRLKRGDLPEEASFHLQELMVQVAHAVNDVVMAGDLMLARRLAPVVKLYERALDVYGAGICNSAEDSPTIEQILARPRTKARDLLEMVRALHPDLFQRLVGGGPRALDAMSEEQLRALLLSRRHRTIVSSGKRRQVARPHPLAELVENVVRSRELEGANINVFVEYLRQGWLWSGPGQTFRRCPWHGQKGLPEAGEVRSWMKIVVPFLKDVTERDALRLEVFRHLLAARKRVFAGERLSDDKKAYIWNQVRTRISQAWKRMASRRNKWVCEKHA